MDIQEIINSLHVCWECKEKKTFLEICHSDETGWVTICIDCQNESVQPDRSKREDHASGCGTQNIADKAVREVQ